MFTRDEMQIIMAALSTHQNAQTDLARQSYKRNEIKRANRLNAGAIETATLAVKCEELFHSLPRPFGSVYGDA